MYTRYNIEKDGHNFFTNKSYFKITWKWTLIMASSYPTTLMQLFNVI